MPRYPQVTPILDGGIGQQPLWVRPENQVADAKNVRLERGWGASKRPGTLFDRKFSDYAHADLRLFGLDYGDDGIYAVVYGRVDAGPVLRIFPDGAAEATLSGFGGSDAANDYLDTNAATSEQIRPVQMQDYSLWINTTVPTVVTASDTYTIERTRPDYGTVIVYSTTVGNYVKAEQDDVSQDAGYWKYQPGSYTYALTNFATLTTSWAIHYGYWDDESTGYTPCGFKVAFRRKALTGFTGATWTAATNRITKANAFTGYTPRAGDMMYLSAGTGLTAGWYLIDADASHTISDIYFEAATGLPVADQTDLAANVTDATYSETNICRIGIEAEVIINVPTMDYQPASMHDIAAELTRVLRQQPGLQNACIAWIPQAAGGNFQITSPFQGNNSIVYDPTAPTPALVGANGDLTAVNTPFDNASVQRFGGTGGVAPDASDSSQPEERWVRAAAPAQPEALIDQDTMPMKLVRNTASTFTIGPETFPPRPVGTSVTNPARDLFKNGRKIKDATIYRDRRVYGGQAGEIAFSASGKHTTFFRDSVNAVTDADPFDRTLPSTGGVGVEFFEQFRRSLIVFTTGAMQAEIDASDAFTGSTASITVSTRVRALASRPLADTAYIYFLARNGDFAQVKEYYYDDLRVSASAGDVTQQVPRLIPATARQTAIAPQHGTLFILPDDGYELYQFFYVYDAANLSDGRKLQAAWVRHSFDASYRICGITVIRDELWMLVERTTTVATASGSTTRVTSAAHGLSDGNLVTFDRSTTTPTLDGAWYVDVIDANTFDLYTDSGRTIPKATTASGTARWCLGDYILERMPLYAQAADDGWKYPVHLDRRITLTGVHSAGTTTFTLPSTPAVGTGSAQFNGLGSTLNKIVLGPAFGADSGKEVAITGYTATAVTVTGDYSAGSVTLGRYYDFRLDLTPPFFKLEGARPIVADAPGVENVSIAYADAGDFTLSIAPTHTSQVFTKSLAVSSYTPSSVGTLTMPASFRSDQVAISVTASNAYPLTVVSAKFDVNFTPPAFPPSGRTS